MLAGMLLAVIVAFGAGVIVGTAIQLAIARAGADALGDALEAANRKADIELAEAKGRFHAYLDQMTPEARAKFEGQLSPWQRELMGLR